MAKRKKINKSAMVRDYLAKHPNARPSEVAEALRSHKIRSSYVSDIKLKLNKGAPKNAQMQQNSATRTPRTSLGENIIAAAKFIRSCGGIEEALEAFEIVQKVVRALE